jgi:hypothetical protein
MSQEKKRLEQIALKAATEALTSSSGSDYRGALKGEEDVDPNGDGNEDREDTSTATTAVPISSPSRSKSPVQEAPRFSNTGGLYGDSSIPSSFPAAPKLAGPSPHQYSDWRLKMTNYFTTNGLSEVATQKPSESLELASLMDPQGRTTTQLKAMWARLQSKAYGIIRAAVENVVGTTFFEQIENDPNQLKRSELYVNKSLKDLDTKFKLNCAYYLWEKLQLKLEQFTPHDLARLFERYMKLNYALRSNPIDCRTYFDDSVRELKLAGIELPEKLHLAIWYKALPSELDSLRQALGANPHLKWTDIYDALVTSYASKKDARRNETAERANIAAEAEGKKQQLPRSKKEQKQLRGKNGGRTKKHCTYCDRPFHDISECRSYKAAQQAASAADKNGGGGADGDHAAVFIEDEVSATIVPESAEEKAAVSREDSSSSLPIHFLFDSAATTHVTSVRRIVQNITNTPVVTMSTAIRGQGSIIDKRGTVKLNDKWTLRDVAYLPNASASLISEGRLADAGYTIIKNKDFVHVRDSQNRLVLKGVRANRLWVLTVDGKNPDKRPINTIIPTPSSPNEKKKPERSEEETASPTTNRRTIPRRNATKPATAGGASVQSE